MTPVEAMLRTYPKSMNVDEAVLAACIDACVECAQAARRAPTRACPKTWWPR